MQACKRGRLSTTALLTCCLVAGCQPLPTKQGVLEQEAARSKLSSHQMRLMVNEYAKHSAERIEMSADRILVETSDPTIRRNALLWKINGIAACFRGASRQNSFGAFLDLWILNRQSTKLFDAEPGEEQFGPWQDIARDTCAAAERRLQHIYDEAGADLPYGANLVESFADEYPLTSLYFDREPIASRYIQEIQDPSREMFQVVADMEENLAELQKLSILYAEYLPKQARWEAELLLTDAAQLAVVQRPLQDFNVAAESISRIARISETLPQLVHAEREAVERMVTHERRETLQELERMRGETVALLQQERATLLDALHIARIDVGRQLETELTRTLQATDDLTRQRVEDAARQVPVAIDHFFWRTSQLVAAVLMIVTGAALWVMWRLHSKSRTHASATQLTVVSHEDQQDMRKGRAA